jgi:protocatechuate 3,4-dioxygenase beta subunit
MTDVRAPIVEVVIFGHNRAGLLEDFVRELHEYLDTHLQSAFSLTIADNGSTDDSFELGSALASELSSTQAVRIEERLGRKELRVQWKNSEALVAAFLEVTDEPDLKRRLAPIIRDVALEPKKTAPPELSSVIDRGISRRAALAAIGTIGVSAFLAACARAVTGSTPATSLTTTTSPQSMTTAAATATTGETVALDCVLVPEIVEGPFYLDLDLVRSDITEDRVGAPLALTIVVADASSCTPIADAAVDLWHCDAEGIYSGFIAASTGQGSGTDDSIFLRGTQISEANGAVTFQTLYPGWYRGRTVHMHMKVHVGGNQVHTTQLFFDDEFTDQVYAASEPYASTGDRDIRNTDDGIYSGGGEATTLAVTEAGDGYAATLTVGVQT